jgi:hypothetical protein
MKKKAVVILSGSEFNQGILDKLTQKNIFSIIIDRNNKIGVKPDIHIQEDVTNISSIIKKIKSVENIEIIGTYTSADIGIVTTNILNRYFCNHGLPDSVLSTIVSKTHMTAKWRFDGLLNRISKSYDKFTADIINFSRDYSIIIKPNDASSSRGITILSRDCIEEELKDAFNKAKTYSSDGIVLIEEFVAGQEVTVELLGDNFGNISVYGISMKYHTKFTVNNRIAIKLHYNPISLNDSLQERIADFAINCFRSLGLKNTFGHLELLIKNDGSFSPIEMNARSAGFVACPLVDFSSGRDYFLDYLSIINGETLTPKFHRSSYSSMYFFYDFPPNKTSVRKSNIINFLDNSIKSIYNNRSNLVEGKTFKLLTCDNDRYGYEILYGPRTKFSIESIINAELSFINYFFSHEL